MKSYLVWWDDMVWLKNRLMFCLFSLGNDHISEINWESPWMTRNHDWHLGTLSRWRLSIIQNRLKLVVMFLSVPSPSAADDPVNERTEFPVIQVPEQMDFFACNPWPYLVLDPLMLLWCPFELYNLLELCDWCYVSSARMSLEHASDQVQT
jgi:hypothetical protein